MKDGILVLNKPQNWTSHDCVAVCRSVLRKAGVKKVGHGGTLDPMACGVLPVFIGKATRLMEYTDLDTKTYRCTARLGLVTDTQDVWGQVLEERTFSGITEDAVRKALGAFHGEIEQTPPLYSAVKVAGKRLYEYARKGVDVEVKPRKVYISSLMVDAIDLEEGEVSFAVTCSKGTYIRTICHDFGKVLGCGAVMSQLTRTASGVFGLSRSVSPEALKSMEAEEIERLVMDIDQPLVFFGKVCMPSDRAKYFAMGNSIRWNQVTVLESPKVTDSGQLNKRGRSYSHLYRVYCSDSGSFLGIGYYDDKENLLKADKILVSSQQAAK